MDITVHCAGLKCQTMYHYKNSKGSGDSFISPHPEFAFDAMLIRHLHH